MKSDPVRRRRYVCYSEAERKEEAKKRLEKRLGKRDAGGLQAVWLLLDFSQSAIVCATTRLGSSNLYGDKSPTEFAIVPKCTKPH